MITLIIIAYIVSVLIARKMYKYIFKSEVEFCVVVICFCPFFNLLVGAILLCEELSDKGIFKKLAKRFFGVR